MFIGSTCTWGYVLVTPRCGVRPRQTRAAGRRTREPSVDASLFYQDQLRSASRFLRFVNSVYFFESFARVKSDLRRFTMSAPQNVIAVVFDFDDTLTDDSTTKLLEFHGIDPADFWKNKAASMLSGGWDPTLAYLKLILDEVGRTKGWAT